MVKAERGQTKAEKANICGYRAYKSAWESLNVPSNRKELLNLWRKLIAYKPYLTNYRIFGVQVGNKHRIVHKAPPAIFVKGLMEDTFNTMLPVIENPILRSLAFHLLFTYIHPFIDGNGRTARLVEQLMLQKEYKLGLCIPISSIILQDKSAYYKVFNSGKTFGRNHLDVLSLDITDFINNCGVYKSRYSENPIRPGIR